MIYKNPIIFKNYQETIIRKNSIIKTVIKRIIFRKF